MRTECITKAIELMKDTPSKNMMMKHWEGPTCDTHCIAGWICVANNMPPECYNVIDLSHLLDIEKTGPDYDRMMDMIYPSDTVELIDGSEVSIITYLDDYMIGEDRKEAMIQMAKNFRDGKPTEWLRTVREVEAKPTVI